MRKLETPGTLQCDPRIYALRLIIRKGFNRFPTEHEIVPIPNYEGIAWDDIWRFNPQASSQWDGFRHFSTDMGDGTRRWYGGTTSDEITSGESDRIGVGHWAQEGIATRGFLIGTYTDGQEAP